MAPAPAEQKPTAVQVPDMSMAAAPAQQKPTAPAQVLEQSVATSACQQKPTFEQVPELSMAPQSPPGLPAPQTPDGNVSVQWLLSMLLKHKDTAPDSLVAQALKRPGTVDFEQLLSQCSDAASRRTRPHQALPSSPMQVMPCLKLPSPLQLPWQWLQPRVQVFQPLSIPPLPKQPLSLHLLHHAMRPEVKF